MLPCVFGATRYLLFRSSSETFALGDVRKERDVARLHRVRKRAKEVSAKRREKNAITDKLVLQAYKEMEEERQFEQNLSKMSRDEALNLMQNQRRDREFEKWQKRNRLLRKKGAF